MKRPERPRRRTFLTAAMAAAIGAMPVLRYARRAAQADEDLRARGGEIMDAIEGARLRARARWPIDYTDVMLSPYDFDALATFPGVRRQSATVLELVGRWGVRLNYQFELFLTDRKPGRGPLPHWAHDWSGRGRTSIAVWGGSGIRGDQCHFEQL